MLVFKQLFTFFKACCSIGINYNGIKFYCTGHGYRSEWWMMKHVDWTQIKTFFCGIISPESSQWTSRHLLQRIFSNFSSNSTKQWVVNNPTNICIFPTNICIFCLVVLCWYSCGCLIQMLPDARWVGFLPPYYKVCRYRDQQLVCVIGPKTEMSLVMFCGWWLWKIMFE